MNTDAYETIVIGGGQAGLSVGYHLAKRNRDFVILDENERVGEGWRRRWDSLRLFTPAASTGYPGCRSRRRSGRSRRRMRWPPTSRPMRTASRCRFEPQCASSRSHRRRAGSSCRQATSGSRREMSSSRPALSAYRSFPVRRAARPADHPAALRRVPEPLAAARRRGARGRGGNSGAEIAYELAETHRCLLAGVAKGEIPVPHGSRRFP